MMLDCSDETVHMPNGQGLSYLNLISFKWLRENQCWMLCLKLCKVLDLWPFVRCFHSNGHNQKVHMHMVDLMSSIICEGDTVSQELLDTVLVNLVPAHKVCWQGTDARTHEWYRRKKITVSVSISEGETNDTSLVKVPNTWKHLGFTLRLTNILLRKEIKIKTSQ